MRKILLILILIFSLSINTFATPSYGKTGESGYFDGDVGVSSGNAYYVNGLLFDAAKTVYPQDYATGTGTAEDPWAGSCIEDAYTACPTGGIIYLRAGYYQLNEAVFSISKAINIIGEGIGRTIIVAQDPDGNAIYCDSTDYVTLQGFTLDCDAQDDNDKAGINLRNSSYFVVRDVEVKNAGMTGINFLKNNYSLMENVWAHDNYEHGIHSNAGDTADVNIHNTYRDLYCYDNGSGGFDDWGDAVTPDAPMWNIYDNIQAWGNGTHGIAICNQTDGIITNANVTLNESAGFYFDELKDFNISDCIVTFNGNTDSYAAVHIETSANLNFTNVIVKNNYTGFHFSGDTSDIKFINCQAYDDDGATSQNYAFELYDTNTGLSLVNCKIAPNANGEIYNDEDDDAAVITSEGNIKMGDGIWTNYIQVTDAGVLTLEGTANIEGVNDTEMGYLSTVSSNVQDQLDAKEGTLTDEASLYSTLSDVSLFLEDLVDDTSPELGGDQDCNNLDLVEVKTVQFNGLYAIGNSGATETVDWDNGAYQSITIDEACVISFSNEYVGTLNLIVTYGGSFALTFDGGATLLEEGGVEIVTTDAAGVDILIFKNIGTADTYVMGALLDVKD